MGAVKRSLDTEPCAGCNRERWQCACPVEMDEAERPHSVRIEPDCLRVSVEATDAAGDPVLLAHEGSTRLGPGRSEKARADIRATWATCPECVECTRAIPSPSDAAWLMTPEGPRLACRGTCFLTIVRRDYMASRTTHPAATRAGAR